MTETAPAVAAMVCLHTILIKTLFLIDFTMRSQINQSYQSTVLNRFEWTLLTDLIRIEIESQGFYVINQCASVKDFQHSSIEISEAEDDREWHRNNNKWNERMKMTKKSALVRSVCVILVCAWNKVEHLIYFFFSYVLITISRLNARRETQRATLL